MGWGCARCVVLQIYRAISALFGPTAALLVVAAGSRPVLKFPVSMRLSHQMKQICFETFVFQNEFVLCLAPRLEAV